MLNTKTFLRCLVLLVSLGLSALLVGCGNTNEADVFESLLIKIELAENKLEEGKPIYYPKTTAFISCVSSYTDETWFCEDERAALEDAYRELADKWDFQADIAEMTSLRLPGSESEISMARDSFIKHINAWNDYLFAKTRVLPNSMFDVGANTQFIQWYETVLGNTDISETFIKACSGLGNSQPSNTDEFRSRIVDICDE